MLTTYELPFKESMPRFGRLFWNQMASAWPHYHLREKESQFLDSTSNFLNSGGSQILPSNLSHVPRVEIA